MKIFTRLLIHAITSALIVSSTRIVSFTGQEELLAADHFLFSYLDQWISRINHTMNRIEQEQEGVTASISNRCFDHMRILLESGQNRSPWALKSKL